MLGTQSSGKSSLIRQLKYEFDGFDEEDASRFVKEVHKAALDACKEVLKSLPPLSAELQPMADRILQLKRRSPLTMAIAKDLEEIWKEPLVSTATGNLQSPQTRQTCKHFVKRFTELATPDYIPSQEDLLHTRIPTMGRQQTRLTSFPGGPIMMYEMKVNLRSSMFEQESACTG